MSFTNYPRGVTSFGIPLTGGLPFGPSSKVFFVQPAVGADGNRGTDIAHPLATLDQAHTLCTSGNNDVVILIGDGSTTATARLSSTLTWSKNATHLIGITAPTMIGQRARISTATGATTNTNPLIEVSGNGCIFANFSIFQGVGQAATDEQCLLVSGQRNYFWNIHVGGIGHANGAARAGSYNLKLYGAQENTFEECTIGLDTITRSAANSNVMIRKNASAVASTRNIFKRCVFPMLASSNTVLFVDGNESGGSDRFNWFKDCMFHNAVNSTGTALTAAVAFHASQGGTTFMDNCSIVGANDWTATDTDTVKITGAVPNGDTSGMAASADAT